MLCAIFAGKLEEITYSEYEYYIVLFIHSTADDFSRISN